MNSQSFGLYVKRRDAEIKLQHLREDLKAVELYHTPTGEEYKNLGPNDTDRKNVLEKRLASNNAIIEMRGRIRELEISFSKINAEIEEAEAQRRGEEWVITRMLAEAMHAKYVRPNPGKEAATAEAVDFGREEAEEEYRDQNDQINAAFEEAETYNAAFEEAETYSVPF